jgi:hypothetical protein
MIRKMFLSENKLEWDWAARRMEKKPKSVAAVDLMLLLLLLAFGCGTVEAAADMGDDRITLLLGGGEWAEALGWANHLPLCSRATTWNSSQVASANWTAAHCGFKSDANVL